MPSADDVIATNDVVASSLGNHRAYPWLVAIDIRFAIGDDTIRSCMECAPPRTASLGAVPPRPNWVRSVARFGHLATSSHGRPHAAQRNDVRQLGTVVCRVVVAESSVFDSPSSITSRCVCVCLCGSIYFFINNNRLLFIGPTSIVHCACAR